MKPLIHLPHLDDIYFLSGSFGICNALDDLESGAPSSIKFDGIGIVCGPAPDDGAFFIGTKSFFNKTPILYKNVEAIHTIEQPDLAKKLEIAFLSLKDVPFSCIHQGDLLFARDKDYTKGYFVEGKNIVFQPNIIAYTTRDVEARNSAIGVVFHTVHGMAHDELDVIPSNEKHWVINPACTYEFDSNFMDECFDAIPKRTLPVDISNLCVMYCNHCIRTTQEKSIDGLTKFISDRYCAHIKKLKTRAGQMSIQTKLAGLLEDVNSHAKTIKEAWKLQVKIIALKKDILSRIESDFKMEINTNGKLKETSHEGIVISASDPFKIVDREVFSAANFSDTTTRGWSSSVLR
jgi:hypothetical protein